MHVVPDILVQPQTCIVRCSVRIRGGKCFPSMGFQAFLRFLQGNADTVLVLVLLSVLIPSFPKRMIKDSEVGVMTSTAWPDRVSNPDKGKNLFFYPNR